MMAGLLHMPPSMMRFNVLLCILLASGACADETSYDPDVDEKSDLFGDQGRGDFCVFDVDCSDNLNLVCGGSNTCVGNGYEPYICNFNANLIRTDTPVAIATNTGELTHTGSLEVTAAHAASAEISSDSSVFLPTANVTTMSIDNDRLALQLWTRKAGSDEEWDKLEAGGLPNGIVFHHTTLDFVNMTISYEGRNSCLEEQEETSNLYGITLGETEFRVGAVPAYDLAPGSYPFAISVTGI